MKKLHLGILYLKELGEWMNIPYSTIRKKGPKEKALDELSCYCSFKIDFGGHIIITEIYEDTYHPESPSAKLKRKWAKEELMRLLDEDLIITCKEASRNVMDSHKLFPLVPKEGIDPKTEEPFTLARTIDLALNSFNNGTTLPIFHQLFGNGINKKTGEISMGTLGWYETIDCSAENDGICCYNFMRLDEEDTTYLQELRQKSQKSKETGEFIEDVVHEDKKDEIAKKVKNYKETIYYQNVIKPMAEYLTKKYGEYRCLVRASLIHFNDEET